MHLLQGVAALYVGVLAARLFLSGFALTARLNMALTKCPECGENVSTKAEKCPHCGRPFLRGITLGSTPLEQEIEKGEVERCWNTIGNWLAVVILILIVGLIAYLSGCDTEGQ